jgi:hypothetical protein
MNIQTNIPIQSHIQGNSNIGFLQSTAVDGHTTQHAEPLQHRRPNQS